MLVKLFSNYFPCVNEKPTYSNDLKEGEASFGILAGVAQTSVSMGFKTSLSALHLKKTFSPMLGVFYDFEMFRSQGLVLSNDLFYNLLSVTGEYSKGGNGTVASTTKGTLEYLYLKTNHMIKLNLLKKSRLFMSGGPSLGMVLKKKFSVIDSYTTWLVSPRNFEPKGYEIGYIVGLGTSVFRMAVEARYEFSYGIVNYSSTERFYLSVRYHLVNKTR